MNHRRTLRLVTLLAVAGLLAVLSALDADSAGGRREAADRARPVAETRHTPADVAESKREVVRFYWLSSERRIRVDGAGELPSIDVAETLRLRLRLRVLENGSWALQADHARASAITDARETGIRAVDVPGELIRGPDGVTYPEACTERERSCWNHILDCLRVTIRDADTWEAEETDATGTYTARYRREGETVVRTLVGYTKLADNGVTARNLTGETRYQLDPLPVLIEGHQLVELTTDGSGQRIEGSMRFELRPVRTDDAMPAPAPAAEDLDEPKTPVKQRISAVLAMRPHPKMILSLVALLRETDAAIAPLQAELKRSGSSDQSAAAILTALAAAGTPQAQTALREVLADSERPLRRRHMALLATGNVRQPAPELLDTLREIERAEPALASSALLVYAGMAGRIRSTDSDRYDAASAHLEALLKAADTPMQRVTALDAMGNLGPRNVHRRVVETLDTGSADERAAAARALARTPGKEAIELLRRAATDEDETVREAVVSTLALRRYERVPGDTDGVLRDVVAYETKPGLRARAATLLKQR